ncbi:hypothetical protein BDF14DRAFT_1845736 [Spinellus fusiger]|nr:hypothetical protein BDF14DRAFT_1845736 [Spinellus fusiger]
MTSVPPTPAPAYVSASISAPMPAPTFPPEAFPLDSQYRYSTLPPLETDTVGVDSISKESQNRAGLTTQPRLVLLSSVGGFWGFAMGSFLGGRQAGLQYLAENAHRLPTTVQGWYFYHKTKNYRVALGGVKRGLRFAARTGGLCLMYGAIEAGLDDIRGEADVANSVVAGVTTGTLFSTLSKWNGMG